MEKSTKINLQLEIAEVNLLLEALGQMPFVKVFQLIENIQQQATGQLNPANNAPNGLKLEPDQKLQ